MNAAALVDGYTDGGADGVRKAHFGKRFGWHDDLLPAVRSIILSVSPP
jgi:hypothetical protein